MLHEEVVRPGRRARYGRAFADLRLYAYSHNLYDSIQQSIPPSWAKALMPKERIRDTEQSILGAVWELFMERGLSVTSHADWVERMRWSAQRSSCLVAAFPKRSGGMRAVGERRHYAHPY